MLRVKTKEIIIRILQNVSALCEKTILKDNNTIISALQESQDAIIVVGERLEKEMEDSGEIIAKLELLCETFYMLSVNLDRKKDYGKQIEELLADVIARVSELSPVYQIVFFPYKADMWDSLESIWLACKDDPLCDCKVVPIPYYHFDARKNTWLYSYEIDRFPEYVPVVHYTDYCLDEHVDAAFVHNPYDEYNHVTRIHSDYYSYNLKKYVKTLFYVPYYVTSGFISEEHKFLPVYQNADCLLVQSQSFKEGLKEYGFDRKTLVVGSPKLDRVVRLNEQKKHLPEEWTKALNGKKTLMLNTSIGQFLYDGEGYLKKLAYIFETIKKRDDVAIIWRPHPLLLSTIESMCPSLLLSYQQLQQSFLDEKIGVLDTTPDITHTVAIVDGYIGETASSVINLFEAAGKPLFILNNYIVNNFTREEARRLLLADCHKIEDRYYCTAVESSDVFVVGENDWSQVKQKAILPNVSKWGQVSLNGALSGGKIYFSPVFSEEFITYDVERNEATQISTKKGKKILNYRFATSYENKVFYLPCATKCIAEYDINRDKWIEHYEPIAALQKDVSTQIYESVIDYCVEGRCIWLCALYTNRVLRFDMENGKYKIYEIGEVDVSYSAISVSENILYLADAKTGAITAWDYKMRQEMRRFEMPDGYQVFDNNQGRNYAHIRLYLKKDRLYAVPGTSNAMVQVDLKTGIVTMVAKEFWEDIRETGLCYSPRVHSATSFAKMVDDSTLFIQKRRDASLLELNLETGEYQIHHPQLASGELERLLEGEDGFEKLYTNGEFARRESRYFSFEGFLDDLVNNRLNDAMARQKKEMETMAVNLDGSCGEKVHEFMMSVLTQE